MSYVPQQQPPRPPRSGFFDVKFTRFLSLTLISVWWVVALVLIAIATLVGVLTGLYQATTEDDVSGGLLVLAGSLVGGAFLAVLTRVVLESVALLFRIGDNTSQIARNGR
jgi:hypothetical protein